jgi:hypothetical protein
VTSSSPGRLSWIVLVSLALVLLPETLKAARTPAGNPTLVIESPAGERTIPAVDLEFVYYERVYYRRHAPRDEEATGERMDVEDRRQESHFLRMEDWTKVKFSKVRQIEIGYPSDSAVARLRVTWIDGSMREIRADSLYGAVDSFAPRFAARVDGEVHEFLLIVPEPGSWPEERLVRLLLKRPPPHHGKH